MSSLSIVYILPQMAIYSFELFLERLAEEIREKAPNIVADHVWMAEW